MSGHFPFAGRLGIRYGLAPRMSISAFYEQCGFNLELQEKYYKWWYDWAKNFVLNNEDLNLAKGVGFNHYPYGQHAHESFHLNDRKWASNLVDLGDLIRDLIFPKLSEQAMKELEDSHHYFLDELKKEAEGNPAGVPEVGYFRHV